MNLLIIGGGHMGGALYGGLHTQHSVRVIENSPEARERLSERFGSVAFQDPAAPCDEQIVILAVKPQALESVRLNGKPQALLSILAGVSLPRLRSHLDAGAFIRAMPNLAALNGQSASVLTGDEDFKEEALEILSAVGSALWLGSEKELDIATALAGSGPGYLALIAEALTNGAVKLGLNNQSAHELTRALFGGMAQLLEQNHPAVLKEMVCSPGGTTIAGVEALEKRAVRAAMMEAVEAAFNRAQALS